MESTIRSWDDMDATTGGTQGMTGTPKIHLAQAAYAGERIGLCGRLASGRFTNSFEHLPPTAQRQMCLACLKKDNTRAAWDLYTRIRHGTPPAATPGVLTLQQETRDA